ncbi:MAG: hypothetical protein AAGI08_02740 [Bacteroidota bacterium]
MALPLGDEGYLDTPRGIITTAGTWFRITEKALRQYAGPVLEAVPLRELLERAETWVRSPQTLGLWIMLPLLALPAPVAGVSALLVVVLWKLLAPSFGGVLGAKVFALLETVWLQVIAYVLVLGFFANWPDFAKVALGLVWFIALRWKLVDLALNPLLKSVLSRLYPLPPTDQSLRAVIRAVAIKRGLSLPEIDRMRSDILDRFG